MIGSRLQDARKHFNDHQVDLAVKLGVSKFTVQSWEQGKSAPGHSILVKICDMYNVSADYLLGITDEKPKYSKDSNAVLCRGLNEENQNKLSSYAEFLRSKQDMEREIQ